MKKFFLLVVLAASAAFAAVDLNKPIVELTLKDGRILKNVVLVSYATSAVMAKWDGGRGTIAYDQFPEIYKGALAEARQRLKGVNASADSNTVSANVSSAKNTVSPEKDDAWLAAIGLASQVEEKLNQAAKFTQSRVFPNRPTSDSPVGFVVLSAKPVFENPKTKFLWLVLAVASVGHILNEFPAVDASEAWFSDSAMAKQGKAYALPCPVIKSLQKKNMRNETTLEELYSEILRHSVERTVKI
jgi:hypothetical protein